MTSRFKRILSLLLTAAVLVSFAACGGRSVAEEDDTIYIEGNETLSGQLLTAGYAEDDVFSLTVDYTQKLNPLTTKSSLNMMVDCLVYDRLFELDDNFEVSSRVLEDWYYTDSNGIGVWVLTVKNGIKMHDGSEMTAADIVYSISRSYMYSTYYQKLTGSVYASAYQGMVYVSGLFSDAQLVTCLTIPIIKSGSIEKDVPPGSGPYMYSKEHDRLEKFDDYEGAEDLPVDTIYLRQYENSETLISEYESALLDITVNDPTGIYNMGFGGTNEKRVFNTTNLHYIGFNSESDFFCYSQYRYAMMWLINRNKIVSDVMDGYAAATALPIHPASSRFDSAFNDSFAYNPERAIAELVKLGCKDLDGDGMLEFALSGMKVEINIDFIVCSDTAAKVQAARRIAEDMKAIGLNVNLRELSWENYKKALSDKTFDMYYAETALSPDWNTLPLFETDKNEYLQNLNYGGWSDKELENSVYSALAAKDDARVEEDAAMLRLFTSDAVILPICFEKRVVVSHLGVITGMQPTQQNIFYNITNWKIHLGEGE